MKWLPKGSRSVHLGASTIRGGGAIIPWEKRVILKHYLDQGVPITALSRQFGINRRIIHCWISTGQLERDLEAEGLSRIKPPDAPRSYKRRASAGPDPL